MNKIGKQTEIISLSNGTIKTISSLSHRKYRKELHVFIAEGIRVCKEALDNGADIVVCPRVTDAAVVIGPAAWKFNWDRNNYDALAGALAAGHIIECGCQATGGNYAFFKEVSSFDNIGYPIAEILEDGSFYVTKHPGTGGLDSTWPSGPKLTSFGTRPSATAAFLLFCC